MFDTQNESKKVPVIEAGKHKTETNNRTDQKIMITIVAAVGVLSVAIVLAILVMMFFAPKTGVGNSSTQGGLGGLQNPNHLSDPDPVTSQDIEDEYQARPAMDPKVPDILEDSIQRYLNCGDFAGLDTFLVEQMTQYKNQDGDEGQGMEDWREKFELLRSDVAKAVNIRLDERPETTFTQFASPDILAAAIAWSPVSAKLDAFADWSSLILPEPRSGGDIQLRAAEMDKEPNEVLAEIKESSAKQYSDLAVYDMVIDGHNIRLFIVGDQFGYYSPWSVQDLDGEINPDIWTKGAIQELKKSFDPWTDLDAVLGYLPQRTESDTDDSKADAPLGDEDDPGNIIPPEGQGDNNMEPEYLLPETEPETADITEH